MKKLVQIASVRVLAYIEANIKAGKDYEGKRFKYSQKPFYRPYSQKVISKLDGKNGAGKLYNIVTGKNGKLGMVIIGGYDSLKKRLYPQAYDNFLVQSGKMLRSMSILKIDDGHAIIGFSEQEQAQKAFWLNISGVGKRRKLWKFLGITKGQEKELAEKIKDEFYKISVEKLAEIIAGIGRN